MTHYETGIIVKAKNGRSQHVNLMRCHVELEKRLLKLKPRIFFKCGFWRVNEKTTKCRDLKYDQAHLLVIRLNNKLKVM